VSPQQRRRIQVAKDYEPKSMQSVLNEGQRRNHAAGNFTQLIGIEL